MKLDDKEVQKIIDHIRSKWGIKAQCPKCYQSSDLIFDKSKIRIFALTEYHKGTVMFGGDQIQIPVVPIFCKNCGHVELLNVNVIEEAQLEKPKETKERKAGDCKRCGAKNSVAIVPDPLNPSMMKDKLHCFACGRTWPVPEDAHG